MRAVEWLQLFKVCNTNLALPALKYLRACVFQSCFNRLNCVRYAIIQKVRERSVSDSLNSRGSY